MLLPCMISFPTVACRCTFAPAHLPPMVQCGFGKQDHFLAPGLRLPSHFLQVVEEYTWLKPNNPLARFLPALRNVRGKGDVFTGLNGFEAVVKSLTNDQGGHRLGRGGGVCCRRLFCRLRRSQLLRS